MKLDFAAAELLWPFDNFTLFSQPFKRLFHYLYHFCHPSCPIDLFIGANFRSFGVRAREKIESFSERKENYYTTPPGPTGTLSPFECDERQQVVCDENERILGLFSLFAQESLANVLFCVEFHFSALAQHGKRGV